MFGFLGEDRSGEDIPSSQPYRLTVMVQYEEPVLKDYTTDRILDRNGKTVKRAVEFALNAADTIVKDGLTAYNYEPFCVLRIPPHRILQVEVDPIMEGDNND